MFNFFSKKREPEQLWFTTDIHCHILPGIDDGASSVEKSIELVERMQKWGITRVFASPHVTYGTFPNTHATIGAAREELQRELSTKGNGLILSNSAEYRIDDLFLKHMEDSDLIPLPNNYLLIENSFMQEPWNLDQLIFDLQVKGFYPVLVHPERYPYYYKHFDRFKAIYNAGSKMQVNLLSLAGYYGKGEKKTAESLIEQGLVDFIGTDLHNAKHADAIDEYLASKDYLRHRKLMEGRTLNDSL